jgi:uncharacterized protein YbbK (DUF523 family)
VDRSGTSEAVTDQELLTTKGTNHTKSSDMTDSKFRNFRLFRRWNSFFSCGSVALGTGDFCDNQKQQKGNGAFAMTLTGSEITVGDAAGRE